VVVGPPTEKRTGRSDIIPMAIASCGRVEGRGGGREVTDRNINNKYFRCYTVHVVELLNYYTNYCTYIKFIKFKH